jgi:hypothetical protein
VSKTRTALLVGLIVAGGCALLAARDAGATPLLGMQAAAKCDSCHVAPDRNDPKWVEENYALAVRKCRATCGACHVNPDGGMLRTPAGQYFGVRSLPEFPGVPAALEKGLSLVKDNPLLTFGGDFRLLDIFYTAQEDKKSPYFFPMQADVYLGSRLREHFSLLTQFGLERGGNPAFREVVGLIDNLPYNAHLKFGKFMPPFGHRLDDHTAFIRKELFVDQSNPVSYGTGVEIGVNPLVAYGRLAYVNETVAPASSSDATSTVASGVLGWQGLWLQLGGSFLRVNDNHVWGVAAGPGPEVRGDRTAYGAYGAVNLWRLTWLFEADLVNNDFAGDRADTDELVTFNELNYLVLQGVNLKARYETLDPNRDVDDDEWSRALVGVEYHPWPFTEFDFQYRYNDTPEEGYGQVLLMVHLWY